MLNPKPEASKLTEPCNPKTSDAAEVEARARQKHLLLGRNGALEYFFWFRVSGLGFKVYGVWALGLNPKPYTPKP